MSKRLGKLLIGTGIGVGIGMLFTKKNGKENREQLKIKIDDLINKTKSIDSKELINNIKKKTNDIKTGLSELDKEKAIDIAKTKFIEINNKLDDLVKYTIDNGTPVLEKSASIVKEKAPEGSFEVVPAVLSFLRLANHENRTVDIYNINYVWSMYAQRKDYSVCTIDSALCTYERVGLIDESDSFEIICRLMEQSEKGIRHLLSSYIDLKGPEYVKRLVKSGKIFGIESQVDFFEIDPENINCLPENIIRKRLTNLIDHYSWSEEIDGCEVRNVLRSDYAKLICNVLSSLDKKVKGRLDDEETGVLDKYGIEYIRENNTGVKREYSPFSDGCISREDFDYIKENHISIIECSRYAGGWYDCLPYVDLYEQFDIQEVRKKYLSIIHNSLFAKVIRGEHIGIWSNIIGNIPAFLEKYEIADIDWERLFNQMLRFMDLSVIYYPANCIPNKNRTDGKG